MAMTVLESRPIAPSLRPLPSSWLWAPAGSSVTVVMCRSPLLDIAHDVLDAGVVLEAVHGQVLAVAGVLEATVRHLGHDGDVGVDPDRAEVEALGHPHGAPVVLGPDAGGEPVLDAVCPANGLVLVGEALDGNDRAEDLVLDHLV